jgi:hypothetical protein
MTVVVTCLGKLGLEGIYERDSWLVILTLFFCLKRGPLGQDWLPVLKNNESAKDKGIGTNPAASPNLRLQRLSRVVWMREKRRKGWA